ncbi:MAG TPA: AI-2E family transporter [Thermoanaerobaculia bacterium]
MLRGALKLIVLAFGVWLALKFLWGTQAVMITAFLGVLLGLAMIKPVDWLQRIKIPRGLGAPLVLLLGIGALVGLGAAVAPQVKEQTKELQGALPKIIASIEQWLNKAPAQVLGSGQPQQQQQGQQEQGQQGQQPEGEQKPQPKEGQQQQGQKQGQQQGGQEQSKPPQGGLSEKLTGQFQSFSGMVLGLLSSTFGALAGLLIVMFLAMYIAIDPALYRKGLMHLFPHDVRHRADEVLTTLATVLRSWLVARLIAMVAIGIITTVALVLLDVKAAIALGIIAGILELIPFFGPIMSAVPAVGIAFVDSPQKGLYVLLLYIALQQLEGNLITPLILERRLDIPPVLTILAVSALGVVFGMLGMLIAEPLLAVVLVVAKMLYVQDVVGDDVKIRGQD